MALEKRGEHYFGDSQDDIRTEVIRFSNLNGYEATQFADALCSCDGRLFHLAMDENEGAAVRTCIKCDPRRGGRRFSGMAGMGEQTIYSPASSSSLNP